MKGCCEIDDVESICWKCGGEGTLVGCIDDICQALGYCIHGDGNLICDECNGDG